MTTVLQHRIRGDTGGTDLKHVFFQYEVFSPKLLDVCLDGATNRTEVVESRASTVDLAALEKDKATLDQIIKEFFVLVQELCREGSTLRPEISSM